MSGCSCQLIVIHQGDGQIGSWGECHGIHGTGTLVLACLRKTSPFRGASAHPHVRNLGHGPIRMGSRLGQSGETESGSRVTRLWGRGMLEAVSGSALWRWRPRTYWPMGAPSQNSPLTAAVVSLRAMSGKEITDGLVRKQALPHHRTKVLRQASLAWPEK